MTKIKNLSGSVLWSGKATNMRDACVKAVVSNANLTNANLRGANLSPETVIPTNETWEAYLRDVVPAFLTAGGRSLSEVATPEHWECHNWGNCPTSAAFGAKGFEDVPALLRPRAGQFIRFFDAGLIPMPDVKP